MKEIQVKIDEETFYIDIEQAKKSGLLKQKPFIQFFQVGDLFTTENGRKIIITPCGYISGRYSMAGLCGLAIYSNFEKTGATFKEMLDHLNKPHVNAKFIKNINRDVEELVTKLIAQKQYSSI